jgi:hypothetical protein
MSKRPSKKRNRRSKALPALGFAGVSLSMAGGACASTDEASANTPPASQGNELFLGEEELSDVSLATFYVFDKENTGPPPLAQQLKLARGCGGGGCGCGRCGGGGGGCHMGGGCHVGCAAMRGCGGMRGCAGWHGGWHGWHGCRSCRCGHFFFHRCRCGHFFFRGCGCGGCGGCGTCWIWTHRWGWVNICWADSTPAGEKSAVASEQSTQTAEVAKKGDGNVVATRTK